MTTAEVVQRLRDIRYNRPPSLQAIAKAAGTSRTVIYTAINTGYLADEPAKAVAAVLQNARSEHNQKPRPARS